MERMIIYGKLRKVLNMPWKRGKKGRKLMVLTTGDLDRDNKLKIDYLAARKLRKEKGGLQ